MVTKSPLSSSLYDGQSSEEVYNEWTKGSLRVSVSKKWVGHTKVMSCDLKNIWQPEWDKTSLYNHLLIIV